MKTKNLFLLVFILSVFFSLTSCGGSSIKNIDKEPNNKIEEAVAIKLDTVPFSTTIQEKGDYDWYKIEIPAQGYFSIMASKIPEGVVPEVKFAVYQEWEENKVKDISDWSQFPAIVHFPEKGTYYFQIHDDYDDAFSKDPIILKTEFDKEFDKYEMNDKIEQAQITNFDQSLIFYIYPKNDYDWFKIPLDGKDGYIKVMLKETNEDVNPEIKFVQLNEWGENKIKDLSGWNAFPSALLLPKEGDLYFEIDDDYNDACSKEAFTLKIEFIPQMDNFEPNNDFKTAKEVAIGDTLSIAIFPKNDQDWFKINSAEADSLKFMAKDWDESINPEIKLYTLNEETNEVKKFSGWENFPHTFGVEANTTYYFAIDDDYGDAASEKPFDVIIK